MNEPQNFDDMLTPIPETPIVREEGESITMSFIDAMREIINGKKVRRISWGNSDYCLLKDGWLTIYTQNVKDTKQEFHTWNINDGDIEGEDWIVVREN